MLIQKGKTVREALQEGALEHSYTRKGFFGTFARIYQTRDLGRPIRADKELGPFGIVLPSLTTEDMRAADGLPMPLVSNGDVTVSVSRRREPMPYCWRNADGDELYFIHRGECRFETLLGHLTAGPADFVYIGRNMVYRMVPITEDNIFLLVETRELLESAEQYHREHGMTNRGVDMSLAVVPELTAPTDQASEQEFELRTKVGGKIRSAFFDFDPVGTTLGWIGDPVVFKLNAYDIPAGRSPFTPPTSAVFLTEARDCVVGIRRPVPPLSGDGTGVAAAPAHTNDWDEVWFYHAGNPSAGTLRWEPQGTTQFAPQMGPPGPPDPNRLDINVDMKGYAQLSEQARAALESMSEVLAGSKL
jgi:homogentisate 1,2-dioxygenase